jgi:hypothetical protein
MKRNYLLTFAIVFTALLLGSQDLFTNSTQPPTGYTGAPGESTCATAGCHFGTPTLNASDVTLGSAGTGISSGYAANTLYNLSVNAGNGFPAYGFSVTAVNASGAAMGTFALTPNTTTTSLSSGSGKQYVGHLNANSTNAWVFRWTSPATTAETVFFYLAVNQANNNNEGSGDNIKLKAYSATASSFGPFNVATGIQNIDGLLDGSISVFPNPVTDNINLSFNITDNQPVKAGIYNLNGQLVKPLMDEELSWGDHNRNFNVAGSLSTGIYLVKFTVGSNDYFKKIVVE